MRTYKRIGRIVAAAGLLVAAPATATTLITDFNNFNLAGTYGSWTSATITSGPDDYRVEAQGWGGGFYDIDPNISAAGETTIELEVTLNPANGDLGGVILVLVDEDITQYNYAWYALPNGHHTLTATIESPSWVSAGGATPGLDLADLSFIHIQVDPIGTCDVSFQNLVLTPEPAGLALLGLGAALVIRKRR